MTKKLITSQPSFSFDVPAVPDKVSKISASEAPKEIDLGSLQALWRENAILNWRKILQESIRNGTKEREHYARWLLGEILQDADYQETWQKPGKFKKEPETKE